MVTPAVPRTLDLAEDRPLADHLGVSGHVEIVQSGIPIRARDLLPLCCGLRRRSAERGRGRRLVHRPADADLLRRSSGFSERHGTLALWPASIPSAWGYRRELSVARAWVTRLGAVSLAGGILGGLLLVGTSDTAFLRLLPWLLLVAAVTFSFGSTLQRMFARQHPAREAAKHPAGEAAKHPAGEAAKHPAGEAAKHPTALDTQHLLVLFLQLLISVYGGYFGGGMGIMTLATLAIAGMTDMHEMNAVKSVLAVLINGVALAEFIALGAVAWAPGSIMVAGGIAGGYVGAATARRVDQRHVRALVMVLAWGMTLYFFLQ